MVTSGVFGICVFVFFANWQKLGGSATTLQYLMMATSGHYNWYLCICNFCKLTKKLVDLQCPLVTGGGSMVQQQRNVRAIFHYQDKRQL